MTTRCKFKCDNVTKSHNNDEKKPFLYRARFFPVHGGSPENDKFFTFTPSGSMDIGVYAEDRFIPGKEYYIDISEAA